MVLGMQWEKETFKVKRDRGNARRFDGKWVKESPAEWIKLKIKVNTRFGMKLKWENAGNLESALQESQGWGMDLKWMLHLLVSNSKDVGVDGIIAEMLKCPCLLTGCATCLTYVKNCVCACLLEECCTKMVVLQGRSRQGAHSVLAFSLL